MSRISLFVFLALFSCSTQKDAGYSELMPEKEVKSKAVDNLPVRYQFFRVGAERCKLYYALDPKNFLSMRDSSGLWSVSMAVELKIKSNQITRSTLIGVVKDTLVFDKQVISDSITFLLPERKDVFIELMVYDQHKHIFQNFTSYWERDFEFISEDLSLWDDACNCMAQGSFISPGKAKLRVNKEQSNDFKLEVYENIFKPALKMFDIGKNEFLMNLKPTKSSNGSIEEIEKVVNDFVEAYCTISPAKLSNEKRTNENFEFTIQSHPFDYNIAPLIYLLSDNNINAVDINTWIKFWSRVSNNEPIKAERLIKEFNKRVEYADNNYSSYKSGWKTDRGMMFILLGRPDRIQNDIRGEVWIYGFTELNAMQFTFERNPLGIHKNDYVLERSYNYRQIWQSATLNWENGWIKEENAY
jgi:GWxTD domain-containing protein